MNSGRHVVVIGGGVIGASCAYYLRRDGWRVTIVDRGKFGRGCSHGNCGYVCPSHVLPLAAPGAIRTALTSLFQPHSAFYVAPRIDFGLWAWLLRFARRCNHRDMLQSGRAIHALLTSSRTLYDELLSTEHMDCEWEARGLLFVFQNVAAMQHYAETDELLRDTFGVAAERYDGEHVCAIEPALKPGLAGGWHYKSDAHLRPDKLMSWWRELLTSRGVEIRESCEVLGLVKKSQCASSLRTSTGDLNADAFVVATGAWTPMLNRELGCRIPIQPGKGYSITMKRPLHCPVLPLILEEHRVAITPMLSGYRIGSTMEFSGYNSELNPKRLQILRVAASQYLQEPFGSGIQEEWFGWRPMTADGKPFIGRSPTANNVLIAAGHGMLGVSMAPATGKLVAEILGERPTHVDPEPYAVRR